MPEVTQIYLPVCHSNGRLLVQVTNVQGDLVGWADGAGKYDYVGTWEVCEAWAPAQAAQLGRCIASLREYSTVTVVHDGLARRMTSRL